MKQLSAILFGCLLTFASYAQSEVYIKEGKAIAGIDPVSYFIESKAVEGRKELVYKWNDANWYFSSEENRKAFEENPAKYAPQFGGYCAFGMADGHKAPTSPDAWTIVDDKLYLNYNNKVKESWVKDTKGNIEKAKKNWPTVKNDKD